MLKRKVLESTATGAEIVAFCTTTGVGSTEPQPAIDVAVMTKMVEMHFMV